jgi:antitoxin (DNA-binding transcriptional repressor) of toxin-antitoxin stability system
MRSLSVSSARSNLTSLLDDVLINHETIIISRKGKPVAHLAPIPPNICREKTARFPLRGISIFIADDFDETVPGLWEALEQ